MITEELLSICYNPVVCFEITKKELENIIKLIYPKNSGYVYFEGNDKYYDVRKYKELSGGDKTLLDNFKYGHPGMSFYVNMTHILLQDLANSGAISHALYVINTEE